MASGEPSDSALRRAIKPRCSRMGWPVAIGWSAPPPGAPQASPPKDVSLDCRLDAAFTPVSPNRAGNGAAGHAIVQRAVQPANQEGCMRSAWRLLAVILTLGSSAAHAAIVFNEGDFSTWIFGSYGSGGGTATMTREASGGNPGARLNATTVTSGATSFGFATSINPNFSTTATLAGTPVTVALDVLSGPGAFGQGQSILVLVEQGGAVYALDLGFTNVLSTFTRLSFNGTLNAASFTLVQGTGPATPNLNGGVVTRFGLATGNSNSGVLTQYYDNVSLDISPSVVTPTSTAPIPTLSEWGLIALMAFVAILGMRRMARH